ncbi:MAG: alpha/beta hydrolase [Burkholderiaceae bacterium]
MTSAVATLIGVICARALIACADAPRPDDIARHLRRGGSAQPTVVLQAGHGDGARSWDPVFDRLAARHAVIAFDRPGYAGRTATAAPRDPCTIADEQHALLQQLGVKTPVVLVGHSLGGRYQWVHAALYPDDVAALVLIEPTHPDHWRRLQTEAPAMAGVVKVARLGFSAMMAAEFDAQDGCLHERLGPAARAAARRIPARVLVRQDYQGLERGAFETMHRALMQGWLELVHAPRLDAVAGAGHYVHRDRPDAVVTAIDEAVAAARSSAKAWVRRRRVDARRAVRFALRYLRHRLRALLPARHLAKHCARKARLRCWVEGRRVRAPDDIAKE